MNLDSLVTVDGNLVITDHPALPSYEAYYLLEQLIGFAGTLYSYGNDDTGACP